MNLEVNLGGIRLANPVVMASGRRRSVSRLRVGGCLQGVALCQEYHGMIDM